MRKVICDKCGGECTSGHGSLSLSITHTTSAGEPCGGDQFMPLDLCITCAGLTRQAFGFKVAQHYGPPGEPGLPLDALTVHALPADLDW